MKRLEDDPRYLALPSEERAKVRQRTGKEIPPPPKELKPVFTPKDLPKVNAERAVRSLVQIKSAPILDKASVLFETAEHWEHNPCSCYSCHMLNLEAGTCMIHGPRVKTVRFVSNGIEFWPACGKSDYGEPNEGKAIYNEYPNDPDYSGLVWINAPKVGQKVGGANCGGEAGGDDCDYYDVKSVKSKRDAPTGFCRVLQVDVANGDRCSAWTDDDVVDWRQAAQLIEKHGRSDGE